VARNAFKFRQRQTRRWWLIGITLSAAAAFAVVFVAGSGAGVTAHQAAATLAATCPTADTLDASDISVGGGRSNFEIDAAVPGTGRKPVPSAGANLTLDGASPFRTFWQIMLPLVRPGIASLAILNFVSLWNEFFYALIFTQDKAKYTVTLGLVYLDQQATYTGKWVVLFASMTMTMVPVLVIFAVLQRQIVKGLTVGAVKG